MFTVSHRRMAFLAVLTAFLCGLLLPWFATSHSEMPHLVWGFYVFPYLLLPLFAAYALVCQNKMVHPLPLCILTESLLLVFPAVIVWAFFCWHRNTAGLVNFSIGWETVLPGYWVSLLLSVIPAAAFPVLSRRGEKMHRDKITLGNEDKT